MPRSIWIELKRVKSVDVAVILNVPNPIFFING